MIIDTLIFLFFSLQASVSGRVATPSRNETLVHNHRQRGRNVIASCYPRAVLVVWWMVTDG